MKDKVTRNIREEEGKVFSSVTTEKVVDGLVSIKTIEEEMTLEKADEYLADDKTQMLNYGKQEKDNLKKIKQVENRIKELKNDRKYLAYKREFPKYELFDAWFNMKINSDFLNDKIKKEFMTYVKKKDSVDFKNYFVTKTEEDSLTGLYENIIVFKDIKEENKLMITTMKEVKRLLKKNE